MLAACAACVLWPRAWQDSVRAWAHGSAGPPLRALSGAQASLGGLVERLRRLWRATEEVARLREENRALREELGRLAAEGYDAAVRLRSLAAFEEYRQAMPSRALRAVPATVIAADTSPWRRSFVVDRGSADGVTPGAPAVWGTSIVGTVVAVRARAATVRLLTDSRAGLTVRVARTGDVGVLRGTSARDGLLQLKWVHLRPVAVGDLVVTSGTEPAVPPGLVAGRVVNAPQAKDHLFYDVRVRPLIDLDRTTELLLLVYGAEEAEELLREQRP